MSSSGCSKQLPSGRSQVCDALGKDPAELYRHNLASVNPDASILKGPFNHADRQRAGLERSWYTTSEWPQCDKERLMQTKYSGGPSYNAIGVPALTTQDLDVLKQRMQHFCDVEHCVASGVADGPTICNTTL
jgi:hypothetical protein